VVVEIEVRQGAVDEVGDPLGDGGQAGGRDVALHETAGAQVAARVER